MTNRANKGTPLREIMTYLLDTDIEVLTNRHGTTLFRMILAISMISLACSHLSISKSLKYISNEIEFIRK